jgi:hypothetical protein
MNRRDALAATAKTQSPEVEIAALTPPQPTKDGSLNGAIKQAAPAQSNAPMFRGPAIPLNGTMAATRVQAAPAGLPSASQTVEVQGSAGQVVTLSTNVAEDPLKTPKAPAGTTDLAAVNAAARASEAKLNKAEMASVKRPAITAANAQMAQTETALVGGAAGKLQSYGPAGACSLIADGVRCKHGVGSTELHQPDAKLKAIASRGTLVWVGGDVLLRSADEGVSWVDVKKPSAEPVTEIVLMPDAVYVRTTSGAMWKTINDGATWVPSSATK